MMQQVIWENWTRYLSSFVTKILYNHIAAYHFLKSDFTVDILLLNTKEETWSRFHTVNFETLISMVIRESNLSKINHYIEQKFL